MPTFCAEKMARVANNFFKLFMPSRIFCELFFNFLFFNFDGKLFNSCEIKFRRNFRPHFALFLAFGAPKRQIHWFGHHICGI
ncbi:hypothetical protein GM50_13535 [freshwater metagenome]|uniref:Uncharacterized protein n=1 Tax=freshwater metagenome TaxID=449393 RepID=A0A094PY71_9ZZZZ